MKQLLIYNVNSNQILEKIDLKSTNTEEAYKESKKYLYKWFISSNIYDINELNFQIINIDRNIDSKLLDFIEDKVKDIKYQIINIIFGLDNYLVRRYLEK